MKKLLFITILVLVFSLSFSFAASKFADVNGTKYETAVTKLNNSGIIDGFTDGSFRPQNSVTRAQLCKLLVEALDLKKTSNVVVTQFKDVESSNWFYDYVKVAVDNGVVIGYTDGTFRPNNDVNYNELITMIIRAMGKEKTMTDKTWPSAYMAFASYYGLLSNMSYPDATQPAIRGEVSIALYNMINRMEEEESKKETFTVKTGFVESTSTKNKVDYAKIDGTTYPVAYRSNSFTEDTYVVFERNNSTEEITLGASYGVKDLDANADIVTAVTGKQGAQEIKVKGSSKYVDYFTSANIKKYSAYGICVLTVEPNSKNVLEVTKHSNKASIEEVKFAVGDRIVEDTKTKVFLVFKGLDPDDKVTKGKYQAAIEYCTVSYKWAYSYSLPGVSLPKSTDVEYGTRYTPKLPSASGYKFYFTNLDSTSFVVKEDTVLYIDYDVAEPEYCTVSFKWASGHELLGVDLPKTATVEKGTKYTIRYPYSDTYGFSSSEGDSFVVNKNMTVYISRWYLEEEEGGHAGSNMPLIDRVSESRLRQEIKSCMFENIDERYGSDVIDARINVVDIEMGDDVDQIKFEVEMELKPASEDVADRLTIPDGYYDEDSGWITGKFNVGILNSINDESFFVTDVGTGW